MYNVDAEWTRLQACESSLTGSKYVHRLSMMVSTFCGIMFLIRMKDGQAFFHRVAFCRVVRWRGDLNVVKSAVKLDPVPR